MIKNGNIYIITKDFDGAVSFYRKLFEKILPHKIKIDSRNFGLTGLEFR